MARRSPYCVEEVAVVRHHRQRSLVAGQSFSSHTIASRSRWLVGSSRSNRSDRLISACPRFSRMRQPPENSATGGWRSVASKPEAVEDRGGTRARRIAVPERERLVIRRKPSGRRSVPRGQRALVTAHRNRHRARVERRGSSASSPAPGGDRPAGRQLPVTAIRCSSRAGTQTGSTCRCHSRPPGRPVRQGWMARSAVSRRSVTRRSVSLRNVITGGGISQLRHFSPS